MNALYAQLINKYPELKPVVSDGIIALSLSKGVEVKIGYNDGATSMKVKVPESIRRKLLRRFAIPCKQKVLFWPVDLYKELFKFLHENCGEPTIRPTLKKFQVKIEKFASQLKKMTVTEIKSEAYVRKGQDILRKFLMELRKGCEISGVKRPELLIASHIRPWKDCGKSVDMRLDAENVLLLAANWDALFDKKFISFDPETGKMIKAARIDDETLRKFGVPDNWRESISIPINTDRRREYLRWHNKLMEIEDAKCRVKYDAGD